MNNLLLESLSKSSLDTIVEMANREVDSVEKSLFRVFVISLAFVNKYKVYKYLYDVDVDVLSGCVTSLTYFLMNTTSEVELTDLARLVNKEISSLSLNCYDLEVSDGLLPLYTMYQSVEYTHFSSILDKVYRITPDRLLPLVVGYIEYGVVFDSMLPTVDKAKLSFILGILGYSRMTVNIEYIITLLPKTNTEKILFLGLLADTDELAFLILTSTNSLQDYFTIIQALQHVDGVITLEDTVALLEKVSSAANLTNPLRTIKDTKLLHVMCSKMDWVVDSAGMSVISALDESLRKENEVYESVMTDLASKVMHRPDELVKLFSALKTESTTRLKLFEELKEG